MITQSLHPTLRSDQMCRPPIPIAPNYAAMFQPPSSMYGTQHHMPPHLFPMDGAHGAPHNLTFNTHFGQGKCNQLGGVYINGRPLPLEQRIKIVNLHKQGVRPCQISRQMRVSHGCVSKIIAKFQQTGTIAPGQGKCNQLGGVYINGRPLPDGQRIEIIKLHQQGVRPCQISRQMRVSHGCVSKIIDKFRKTGTIAPGQVGGSRNGRQLAGSNTVEQEVHSVKRHHPYATGKEIRNKLIDKGVVDKGYPMSNLEKILSSPTQHSQPLLVITRSEHAPTTQSSPSIQSQVSIKSESTSLLQTSTDSLFTPTSSPGYLQQQPDFVTTNAATTKSSKPNGPRPFRIEDILGISNEPKKQGFGLALAEM